MSRISEARRLEIEAYWARIRQLRDADPLACAIGNVALPHYGEMTVGQAIGASGCLAIASALRKAKTSEDTALERAAAVADAWAAKNTAAIVANDGQHYDRMVHAAQRAAAEGIARLIRGLHNEKTGDA